MMVDSATRLECAKCLELLIPTEFFEHITNEDQCKESMLWNKNKISSKNILSSKATSPALRTKNSGSQKENMSEEINPVSERCSYSPFHQKVKRKSPYASKDVLRNNESK
jgi:hypothetical protein